MEYMTPSDAPAQQQILCCECGTLISPNPANMCVACIRTRVDITEHIPKQTILHFCRFCERYLQPPSTWMLCALESRELLALCLKKLKGLSKVRLIDASFIWTEPHSKRLKVNLTVQGEAFGTILQQTFVVEYIIHYQMCEICCKRKGTTGECWKALVQVRQRTRHKKTMYYIEQLILKHNMHTSALNIKENEGGLNFFYLAKNNARKMVDFLLSVVPCQYKTSQELVSHDINSNVFNYKYTFFVEVAPICKDEVVCLPLTISRQLNHMNQLVICSRINELVHLIDPYTLKIGMMGGQQFYRETFEAVCHQKQLREFMVMNIEEVRTDEPQYGKHSNKHKLCDVWVLPVSSLGTDTEEVHTRTHLGNVLQCGDYVLGFDVEHAVVNNAVFDKMTISQAKQAPDVILVKKIYPDKLKRQKNRNWRLKHIRERGEGSVTGESDEGDYNDFLEDLEEDPELRKNINMYKQEHQPSANRDVEAEEACAPRVGIEELLDELNLEAPADVDDDDNMLTEDKTAHGS